MSPTVSVIIPAYNRATTILHAIRSVLGQTFQDFELIVVDDGSTDLTGAAVQNTLDRRIRLLRHEKNLGAAAARNTGMQAARGAYVAWLDSDDEWLPGKLEIQLRALADSAHKASYTAFERVEGKIARVNVPENPDYKKLFLGCGLGPGSTLLFDRSLLDEIGYLDLSLRRYEDWDWLLRYCEKYSLLVVEQPLAKIHFSPNRPSVHVETSSRAFIAKYSETLRQFGWSYRNRVISRRWVEVSSYCARERKLLKSLYFLAKGFITYPFHGLDVWAWVVNGWFDIKIGSYLTPKDKIRSERRND